MIHRVSMRNGLALRLMREKRKLFSNFLGRQSPLVQLIKFFLYIYGTPQDLQKEFLGILGRQSLKRVDSVIKCFSCKFGFVSL